MAAQGWISIHRQLQKHWLWEDKPFSRGQAWIDILMLANHKDNKFRLGNELVEVKAGSFITSIEKLRIRWGWSNTKIVNFLKLLERDGMIVKKSDTKKTVITVENYALYQLQDETETMRERYESDAETIREHTNNNDNNDNNDNKLYDYDIAAVFTTFQHCGFQITGYTSEELIALTEEHSAEWVIEALKRAAVRGNKTLSYVKGILNSWKNKGAIDNEEADKKGENGNAGTQRNTAEPQYRMGIYV